MFIYRRRGLETDGRAVWLLGIRAVVSLVVLATDWGILRQPIRLDTPHLLYLVFAALVFFTYSLYRKLGYQRLFYLCLSVQFIAELTLIGGIIESSGGISSQFFALYLLTIVSAAVSYRLIGTLLIATAAAVSYIIVVYTADPTGATIFDPRFWQNWTEDNDPLFYSVFLRICIFYILAFISGYLAQKLQYKDEALATTSRALQAARTETGDILKHLHSGLLTIDADGRVTYFNQAAEDILKISAREVQGRPIKEAFAKRYPELAERLLWVYHAQRGNVRGEIQVETAPEKLVPLGISTSIMGTQENQRGVIAVFQDITEAKLMEERMRLKDRMAAIGELAAGIAHEIRNPLAAISGSVEVLINELDVQDDNRNLLELIVKESSRLNDIITEFLFYSRIRPTVLGRVRLGSVVDEVVEIVKRHPQFNSRVTIQARPADPETLVQADEDHLKQLLLNLVINAVDAIGDEAGIVTIHTNDVSGDALPEAGVAEDDMFGPVVKAGQDDQWLRLTVADDGPGIPPEIRDKIWQPFFSTKRAGTGLGLAVVQRLVENLSGQIALDSTPEQGTSINVFLKKYVPRQQSVKVQPELITP